MPRSIHSIAGLTAPAEAGRSRVSVLWRFDANQPLALQLIGTVGLVLVGTLIAELLRQNFGLNRLSMFFLGSVVVSALAFGTRAGVFAAFLAILAYNFSLVEPRFAFRFAGAEQALTLGAFLFVALVTGSLAGRVRESERTNRRRADLLKTLFDASQAFTMADGEISLRQALTDRLRAASGNVALVIAAHETLNEDAVPVDGKTFVHGVIDRSRRSPALQIEGEWRARRLSDDEGLGLAVWRIEETRNGDVTSQDRLCELLIDLAAASLARARLAEARTEAEAERRAGRLREAILGSLSHDLRTPLATVMASASSLRDYDQRFDSGTRIGLADGIVQEAGRLNDYLEALFSLSRIESGDLTPHLLPVSVREVIDNVRSRLGSFGETRVTVHEADPADEVQADPLLLEQALFNILDNVELHGGKGVVATVQTRTIEGQVMISIEDDGPGVSASDGARLFDKFYRGRGQRPDGRGTGVGLSISKGFVEAMGGTLGLDPTIRSRPGLRLLLRLPVAGSQSI